MSEPNDKNNTTQSLRIVLKSGKTAIIVAVVLLLVGIGLGVGIDKIGSLFSQSKVAGGTATNTGTNTGSATTTGTATTTDTATSTDTAATSGGSEQKVAPEPALTSTDPIKDGKDAFAKQNYALALKYFDLALPNEATKAEGYHWRGNTYAASQLPDTALKDYDQAIGLLPNSVPIHLDRAAAYFAMRDFGSAIRDYDAILQIDRSNTDALLGRSLANNEQGSSDAALTDVNQLISIAPSAKAYKLKGDVLYLTKRWNEALAAYNQGLNISPNDLELRARQARTYVSGGNFKYGLKLFEKLSAERSDRGDMRNDLGYAQLCNRSYFNAVANLSRCKYSWASPVLEQNLKFACQKLIDESLTNIRRGKNAALSYSHLAYGYMFLPDLDAAERSATQAVQLNPRDEYSYYILGRCQVEKDQNAAACDSYGKAIELKPRESYLHFSKAIAFTQDDKHQQAVDEYRICNQLEKDSLAYANEATNLIFLERYEEAESAVKESLNIDSHCTDAMSTYADIWEKRGNYTEAVAWLNRALSENPYSSESYEHRGLAYFEMGEMNLALEDVRKGLKLDQKARYSRYSLQMILMVLGPPDALVEQSKIGASEFRHSERDYLFSASLFPWFAFTQIGDASKAKQYLEDGLSRQTRGSRWPVPLAEHIAGRKSADEMLATCADNGERTEAHTWLGAEMILKGDKAKALDEFNWVVKNGIPSYLEASLAKAYADKLTAETQQKTALQK